MEKFDIDEHVHGEPVVVCKNPLCRAPQPNFVRLPLTNPPRTGEHRETTPLDNKQINYICRSCDQLSVFGKNDVRWIPTADQELNWETPQKVLWKIRYQCGEKNCGDRIEVFVDGYSFDKKDEIKRIVFEDATHLPPCKNGHIEPSKLTLLSVRRALII
jgi:hypothetical protein